MDRLIGELRPGKRAKAALARMLPRGANLLLLDEPTEHLEVEALGAEVPDDRRTCLVVGSV